MRPNFFGPLVTIKTGFHCTWPNNFIVGQVRTDPTYSYHDKLDIFYIFSYSLDDFFTSPLVLYIYIYIYICIYINFKVTVT